MGLIKDSNKAEVETGMLGQSLTKKPTITKKSVHSDNLASRRLSLESPPSSSGHISPASPTASNKTKRQRASLQKRINHLINWCIKSIETPTLFRHGLPTAIIQAEFQKIVHGGEFPDLVKLVHSFSQEEKPEEGQENLQKRQKRYHVLMNILDSKTLAPLWDSFLYQLGGDNNQPDLFSHYKTHRLKPHRADKGVYKRASAIPPKSRSTFTMLAGHECNLHAHKIDRFLGCVDAALSYIHKDNYNSAIELAQLAHKIMPHHNIDIKIHEAAQEKLTAAEAKAFLMKIRKEEKAHFLTLINRGADFNDFGCMEQQFIEDKKTVERAIRNSKVLDNDFIQNMINRAEQAGHFYWSLGYVLMAETRFVLAEYYEALHETLNDRESLLELRRMNPPHQRDIHVPAFIRFIHDEIRVPESHIAWQQAKSNFQTAITAMTTAIECQIDCMGLTHNGLAYQAKPGKVIQQTECLKGVGLPEVRREMYITRLKKYSNDAKLCVQKGKGLAYKLRGKKINTTAMDHRSNTPHLRPAGL